MRPVDRAEEIVHARALPGTDEVDAREREEGHAPLERLPERLAPFAGDRVPLVHGHHERPALVDHERQQRQVLLGQPVDRVDQQHAHVRPLDRLQGLDDREDLDLLVDLAATTDAGGVDEGVGPPAPLEGDRDRVARGARPVVGDHPLLAEQPVHERGLADVRTADEADHGRSAVGLRGRGRRGVRGLVRLRRIVPVRRHAIALLAIVRAGVHLGPGPVAGAPLHRPAPAPARPTGELLRALARLERHPEKVGRAVHQASDPAVVRRRQRHHGLEAELVELERGAVVADAVDLVDREQHRRPGAPQPLGDLAIGLDQTVAAVDDEHHEIALLDGGLGLGGHRRVERLGLAGEPAGVDEHVGPAADAAGAVLTVAREPRVVGHERVARPRQTVEQRRLPDVRSPDQRDDRDVLASGLGLRRGARVQDPPVPGPAGRRSDATVPSTPCTTSPRASPRGWARIGASAGRARPTSSPSASDRACT